MKNFHLFIIATPFISAFSIPTVSLRQSNPQKRRLNLSDIGSDFSSSRKPTIDPSVVSVVPESEDLQSAKKYGWQKAPPKKSLDAVGQGHTAQQWFLNIIEAGHWTTLFTNSLSTLAIMQNFNTWSEMFGHDALRLTLWMAFPLVQAASGIAPFVYHIYEDWQIAPTLHRYEEQGSEVQSMPDVEDANNERLRQVSYSMLFSMLGLSAAMSFHAFHGWSLSEGILGPASVLMSMGFMTYSALGDDRNLLSNIHPSLPPLSVSTSLWFLYSQIMAIGFVYIPLASMVDDGHIGLKAMILLAQILATVGGILETGFCERNFDQKYHFGAISFINIGAILHWQALAGISEYLS